MPSKILGKPESHSDVINREPRTLLLGYGWVGQHVHRYFKNADYFTLDTGLCDKNNNKLIVNKPRRSGKVWDLAFISVDRKSTRLNSSHIQKSRMPSSA